MKVIVSGSTGLIGGGALHNLLKRNDVTSVVALSRREVDIKDAKLDTVILKDFNNYDQDTLKRLEGAEACVWALGTPTSGADVHEGYTFAAADAFAHHLMPKLKESGKTFRFVYVSGGLVETNAQVNLWFLGEMRKMRGRVENNIVEYQTKNAPDWQTFVARPLMVTNGPPLWRFAAPSMFIPVDELGAALADLAVIGGGDVQRLANADLRRRGQQATQTAGKL